MFDIINGDRQGYILSPFLFLIILDSIMRKSLNKPQYGISWRSGRLADLDVADDTAVLRDS